MTVKIDMHIEQCNVVVIIKYEIKSMKTLEDTISKSWLVRPLAIPEPYMHINVYFQFQSVQCESVVLISQ